MPEIVKALEQDLGWDLPTDIQEEAVPMILGGGDVLAAAETGSGKTGAFSLPLVQIVYETLRDLSLGKQDVIEDEITIKMSLDDRESEFAVSEDGSTCQSRNERQWAGGRANIGLIKGKYYYEITCRDAGLSRMGWALASASYNIGTDNKSYGFGGTGKKSHRNQFDAYGSAFGNGNIVGCYLDCDGGKIGWSVNGNYFGDAFTIVQSQKGSAWFPAIVLKNAEVEVNLGLKPFKYPPTGDYIPVTNADPQNTSLKSVGTLSTGRSPLALILEPSRELAEQTHVAIETFLKYLPPPKVKACLFVGGTNDTGKDLQDLKSGVDIVSGTIGRVESLISQNQLSLKNIRFFVIDEADQLIDNDNVKSILGIYKKNT